MNDTPMLNWSEEFDDVVPRLRRLSLEIDRLLAEKGAYKIDFELEKNLGHNDQIVRRLTLLSRLALISSEVGEAIEEARKPAFVQSKNVNFLALEEEVADILIRCFSLSAQYRLRVFEAMIAKLQHVDTDRPELQKIGKVI